jgi:Orotate phosphoribosyltransferase
MDPRLETLADGYIEAGIIQFRDFVLKSDRRSHFYFDLKFLRSAVEARKQTAILLLEKLQAFKFDIFADIPIGSSPIVNTMSDISGTGYITPRAAVKDHGTGVKIEGRYKPSQIVLPGEDVTTSGGSLLEGIATLREAGLVVNTAFVVLDRQQGSKELLSTYGVELISLFDDPKWMIEMAHSRGAISDEETYEKVMASFSV